MLLRKKIDRTLNRSYLYLNTVAQCSQARRDLSRSARLNALVTHDALALKMCMFIQEYSLYRSIDSADLLSHSFSSRHTEQIRITNRTVKLPIFYFSGLSPRILWNEIIWTRASSRKALWLDTFECARLSLRISFSP